MQREVILGVGGGIAAYKACDLLRRMQDAGWSVTVVPTPSSLNFVGKATWEALSGRTVTTEVFESVEEIRHISLAKKADYLLIAPATADLIARIAHGRADDLLTNIVLATEKQILLVPAMHPQMWNNAATVENIKTLRSRGITILDPATGALTSGDIGQGRFPDTSEILGAFHDMANFHRDLQGKKILVTAGGTREPIDPVRFIGNRSSGKQGIAIAEAAALRGAEVTLIAANVSHPTHAVINRIDVESAAEMGRTLSSEFRATDILIMAAAVADARPKFFSETKIKKSAFRAIELEENPDLLKEVAAHKEKQFIIAFAAESSLDVEQARSKMATKGADAIYLNDISHGDIFNSETTEGVILLRNGEVIKVAKTTKDTLAHQLLDQALRQLG